MCCNAHTVAGLHRWSSGLIYMFGSHYGLFRSMVAAGIAAAWIAMQALPIIHILQRELCAACPHITVIIEHDLLVWQDQNK